MKIKKFDSKEFINSSNLIWLSLFFIPSFIQEVRISSLLKFLNSYFVQPWASLVGLLFIFYWFLRSSLNIKCQIAKWSFPLLFWAFKGLDYNSNWTINAAIILFIAIYLIFIIIIIYHTYLSTKNQNPKSSQGLLSDDPIEYSLEEKDSYGRKDYAKSIVKEIKETSNKRAFNIAITGAWGSGKTSFLNLIKGFMENYKDQHFFIVSYNPWDFKEDKIIGIDLLKTISNDLSKEKEIQEKFKRLMLSLQGVNQNPFYKIIPFWLLGLNKEKSINDHRKEIGQILQNKNKKLVIFLDDLDRLNGEEILEVFKTIRNSFDISNTFFVLGFDIDYVADQIKEKVNRNSDVIRNSGKDRSIEYLDKIFQMRLNMPSNSDFDFIKLLESKLNVLLDSRVLTFLREIFTKLTYRDIILISNGFKVFDNSTGSNNDFDATAVVLIQIISLKYPELYSFLSYNDEEIIRTYQPLLFPNGARKRSFPQSSVTAKLQNANSSELIIEKLKVCLVYCMTPQNNFELSKKIYNSYFKFKTHNSLISRSALYVAINESDQDFINKHLGTEKEADLFNNLEISLTEYNKLDQDQIEFITKNLINNEARLLSSEKSLKQLLKTNVFNYRTNYVLKNEDIFKAKNFLEYLDEQNFSIEIRFRIIAKFWYIDSNSLNFLQDFFHLCLNENNPESGYIFKLLYMDLWPQNTHIIFQPRFKEIKIFRQNIKDLMLSNFEKNPIKFIQPFIFKLTNNSLEKYSYNPAIGSINEIIPKLDTSNSKQFILKEWLTRNSFQDLNGNFEFHQFEYQDVFEEEYEAIDFLFLSEY